MITLVTEKAEMSPTGEPHTYYFSTKKSARQWVSNAKRACRNNDAGTKSEINESYVFNYNPAQWEINSAIRNENEWY
jgi:hypothetical protein